MRPEGPSSTVIPADGGGVVGLLGRPSERGAEIGGARDQAPHQRLLAPEVRVGRCHHPTNHNQNGVCHVHGLHEPLTEIIKGAAVGTSGAEGERDVELLRRRSSTVAVLTVAA